LDGIRFHYFNNVENDFIELKLKYLTLDNNKPKSSTPVIFSPLNLEELQKTDKNFLEATIIHNRIAAQKIRIFDYFRVAAKPWQLKLNGVILEESYKAYNRLIKKLQRLRYCANFLNDAKLTQFEKLNEFLSTKEWKKHIPSTTYDNDILIRRFIFDPISTKFHYTILKKQIFSSEITNKWVNNFESCVKNSLVTDVTITGMKVVNYFSSLEPICLLLVEKAVLDTKAKILYLPNRDYGKDLVQNKCTEYEEINEKNYATILKKEDAQRISEFSNDFIKAILQPHRAVSKTLYRMSDILTTITMDETMEKQRREFKDKKAKHVIHGFGQGVTGFLTRTKNGVQGFFLKPFQGMKKDGLGGMAKGLVSGTAGLLFSPLIGLFDVGSKTIEGLANTPQHFFETRKNDIRARAPRVFYGVYRAIKEYEENEANLMQSLRKIDENAYSNLRLYGLYKLNQFDEKEKRDKYLIITVEYVLLYVEGSEKVEWVLPSKNFRSIDDLHNMVKCEIEGKLKVDSRRLSKHSSIDMEDDQSKLIKEDLKKLKDERYLY